MSDSIILGTAAAVIGAVLAAAAGLWIGRQMGQQQGSQEDSSGRMARDLMVVSDLLADRLAKIWTAGDGPAPGVGDSDSDAVYHHVRESTETILKQAGASPKTALAVGALTAKHVRPGPIAGSDGEQPRPGHSRRPDNRPAARPDSARPTGGTASPPSR